jgi:hypothetical protein
VVPATTLAPDGTMRLPVAGQGGLPPGVVATAVVLNTTVTGPAADG